MATIRNSLDKILQAALTRTTNLPTAQVIMSCSTNSFHVTAAGANDPASITFYAAMVDLEGAIVFSCTGGTLTSITATSATLTYANMSAATATVTATVTSNGQPYSDGKFISKVQDGAPGGRGDVGPTGPSGPLAMTVYLYQWSSVAPAAPTGTSSLNWPTLVNSAYSTSDGWSVTVPANPGTPGVSLFTAAKPVTAPAGTTTTAVSYSGATVAAWSQNGANGAQAGSATVYQWAATIPSGPTGTASFTWATGLFGAAPTNYTLTPGTAPSPGMTLWAGRVQVTDTAGAVSTPFNWSSAAVMAIGYAGSNGVGAEGASYVTAYCASSTGATSTAPAATTGRTSLPAANSGGLTGTYSATVPTLTTGQYLYQTDGIYNPATNQVIWSIPYWSSLKVGSLSAIVTNTGDLNVSGMIKSANDKFQVDSLGNVIMRSASIQDSTGSVILAAGAPLAAGYEAAGTKNADLAPSIASAAENALWANIASQANAPSNNASSDIALVGRGVVISGNYIRKVSGAATWDADAYSRDSYTGGAYASAVADVGSSVGLMFGLNTDPVSSTSFASIDYALYLASGDLNCYEGNIDRGTIGAYVGGDALAVVYDGTNVLYMKNGAVLRTVPAIITAPLFFDSSFNYVGGTLSNVRFGPMSNNSAGTSSLAAINHATTGLAQRLRANAVNVLGGGGAVTIGSLTVDSAGNRTGGNGVGITAKGLAAYNSGGAATVVIDAVTGAISVAGDISGSTGTFGAVTVGASLSSGMTAYATGSGYWLEYVGGVVKFSLGSSTEYLRWTAAGGLELKLATFSVALSGTLASTVANGSQTYSGLKTATITGGVSPFTYSWSTNAESEGGTIINYGVLSGDGTSAAAFKGSATNNKINAKITVIVTDSRGLTATASANHFVTHGTYTP